MLDARTPHSLMEPSIHSALALLYPASPPVHAVHAVHAHLHSSGILSYIKNRNGHLNAAAGRRAKMHILHSRRLQPNLCEAGWTMSRPSSRFRLVYSGSER